MSLLKTINGNGASQAALVVKNPPANARDVRDAGSIPGMGRSGFPCSSVGKESACNAGDPGLMLGLRKSPGVGDGSPLQYPCLENPMDRGGW